MPSLNIVSKFHIVCFKAVVDPIPVGILKTQNYVNHSCRVALSTIFCSKIQIGTIIMNLITKTTSEKLKPNKPEQYTLHKMLLEVLSCMSVER